MFSGTKHSWIIDSQISEIVEPYEFGSFKELTDQCDIQLNTLTFSGSILQCLNPNYRKTFNILTKTSWTLLPALSILIPIGFGEYNLLFCLLIYPLAFMGSALIRNMFSGLTWIVSISLTIYFAYSGLYIGILTAILPLIMLIMQKSAKKYFVNKVLTAAYSDELSFKFLLFDNLIHVQDGLGRSLKIKAHTNNG